MITKSNLFSELRNTARQAKRTWAFLTSRQRLGLAAAVVLMAGVGYLTAQIPVTLGGVVDGILGRRILQLADAWPFLSALIAAYLAREVLQVVRKSIVEGICTTVERNATVAAVSRLFQSDLGTLKSEQAGSLNGRLTSSVTGVVKLLKLSYLDLFPAAFGAGFALWVAIAKNPMMGLLMAAVVPMGLIVIVFQLNSQRGVRLDLLQARRAMDGTVVEQIGGIEAVRAADTMTQEVSKVRAISEQLRSKEYRHHIAMSLFDAIKSLNEGAFHIAVVTFALVLSLSGALSAGDVLAFSILFLAVVNPLREIHRIVDEAHESGLRAESFFAILSQQKDRSFQVEFPRSPAMDSDVLIEARNLFVGYVKDGEDSPEMALRDFTLSVRRGEIVGFAGPSGSGKTTVVRALLRLVHPLGGSLRIGGVDIADVTRAEIGKLFGLVSQTPFLFTGTIADNISYGCSNATDEAIRNAAAMASVGAEIDALPNGYQYMVSERGENLSGGQRQRIALARIFLQDPPVLILDEATAALDNKNERHVMEAIGRAVEGRTVLMVAHRLSTLQRADRIVVLKDGRLVEEGTFAMLSGIAGGVFAGLVEDDQFKALAA